MAQATLLEMAREVHLYSGGVAPVQLCQRWVRDRYRAACERGLWSFKIGRSQFFTVDSYSTGTVALTAGSATVTGTSTVWTSSHVGLQFKANGFVYTISAVGGNTSLTLDRNWEEASDSESTYEIVKAYITPSDSDFHAFVSVLDPSNGWQLHTGFSVMDLDRADAERSSSSTPTVLAAMPYSSTSSQYELWPHPTTRHNYPYIYEKRLADLSAATDTPHKIVRSDILIKGALADLVRWPGTNERKNPMYDPNFNQWKSRDAEFREELDKVMVEDQSILMTDLSYYNSVPYAPLDAKFRQQHAFGVD